VRILRDSFDVPHVIGKTQADVEYGAGYVTAEDRGLLLNLIRGPARVAAIDAPGLNPIALALSGQAFTASPQTERFLEQQVATLAPAYRRLLQAYVAGINAYFRTLGGSVAPFTRNDVTAIGALIGAVFGAGGGDEARRSELFSAPGSRGLARERRA